jgi:hypothetical protein|tara:strand:- start:2062 stop:2208 length:147 start_codon:yes stop_codon:yes gene_type:complete
MLQLGVAKELGYSLARLHQEMTLEELFIWSSYFEVLNDEQEAAMKRRR